MVLSRALRDRELVPVESTDRKRRPAVGDRQLLDEELVVAWEEGVVSQQALPRRHVGGFLGVGSLAVWPGEVLHELPAALGILGALRNHDRPAAGPRRGRVALVGHGDVGDPVVQVRRVLLKQADHPVTADNHAEVTCDERVLRLRKFPRSLLRAHRATSLMRSCCCHVPD